MRRSVARCSAMVALGGGLAVACGAPGPALATSIAPPMLDITGQCSATARRNVVAMSECVVAESEARAEILQQWDHVSDGNAERCIQAARTSKHFPYSTIAKCLAEPVAVAPALAPPLATVARAKPAKGKSGKGKLTRAAAVEPAPVPVAPAAPAPAAPATTSTFAKWKQFFSK